MSKVGIIAGAIAVLVVGVIAVQVTNVKKTDAPVAPEVVRIDRDLKLQDWHEYRSPRNDFKVSVPTLPQHATESAKDRHQLREAFVSEADVGTLFMINMIVSEDPSEKISDLLTHTVDDFIKSIPDNKVLSKQTGTYKNNPSIDFSLENPDVIINGKAFIKGNTLYLLSSTAKKDNYYKDEFDYFVNSFELANAEAVSPLTVPAQLPTQPAAPTGKAPAVKVK